MTPKNADLNAYLKGSAASVEAELERLIPKAETEPCVLHKAIRHSIFAGGKRLRPALVFATGEALGATRSSLLRCAAAVEMIHTYSLIHDDLPAMDDDYLRRGRQTCHVKFGEATAILAGDVLQALAFEAVAADDRLDYKTRVDLILDLALAAGTPGGMAAGQQLDLRSEGKEVTADDLEQIHRKKTGALIVVSARAGARIGNAGPEIERAVSRYADLLGLLYQITDDLLDVTQTTDVLGKTAGKDATAEKATYPSIYGIAEAQKLAADVHRKACEELLTLENPAMLKFIADRVLDRKT